MTTVPISDTAALRKKVKEAEAYRSQGLFHEALDIYEQIFKVASQLDPDNESSYRKAIQLLSKEIKEQDQQDYELTSQDISLIRQTWTTKGNVNETVDSASAFKELGMFKEAQAEYEKLLGTDYPLSEYMEDFIDCLFGSHSPSRVIDQIDRIINEHKIEGQNQIDISFLLGNEMEKREHMDLALEFYETVKKLDPHHKGLQDRLRAIESSRSYDSRYGYLLESKIVNPGQLQNALALSKQTKKSVEYVLMDKMSVKKEDIGKSLSFFYKCPFKSFDENMPVPYELLTKLKKMFLIQNSWVPLNWEMSAGVVEVLIEDPADLTKTDSVYALIKAKKINFSVGTREDIQAIINHFFNDKKTPATETVDEASDSFDLIPDIEFEEDDEDAEDLTEEMDETSSHIVRLVDQILISAYRKGASDIHIEPSPVTKKTSVRFRIDGVCQEILQIPNINARGILSRLKIMSGLDIAERRLPQDGKIKFKRKGVKPFELRLATLPTAGSFEDAVLRILAESGAMKLDNMGIKDRNLDCIKRIISQPYGLFLVVGPTGSGKTTTLHSALDHINKPGIKIWTAEDPIEITQGGLRQVECKPKIGLDFARVMRAFLRADPDVIMIGEMRDYETASIGVEASLTGHLVFSTLHTNSAPETVTRLLDMGLNPLNFSDAFLGVLAQRLVRRICKNCRKEYHPTEEEFEEIQMIYGADALQSAGYEYAPDLTLYKAEGCEACFGSGYKGRLGIHELMDGTKVIKNMIKKQATSEDLFIQAAKDGMTTLLQDGIEKVFQGLTDLDEIRRVCVI